MNIIQRGRIQIHNLPQARALEPASSSNTDQLHVRGLNLTKEMELFCGTSQQHSDVCAG